MVHEKTYGMHFPDASVHLLTPMNPPLSARDILSCNWLVCSLTSFFLFIMFHFICKHTVIDKSAAADCFFYLYTLFCIWIDSYFYCPIYFPHLIPTCLQMISIAIPEQYVLFYYNTSHLQEQVFPFLFIKFF